MHNKRRQNNMNGGGGQHRHNNNNRPRRFSNNRPQGGEGGNDAASIARTRRNATQNRDKYLMMARDAQSSGDRVLNEFYLQHADHYHRVLLALPPEEIRPQHQQPRNFNQPGEHGGGEQQGQPQEGGHNAPDNGMTEEHPAAQQQHHGLPSFITQPQGGGGGEAGE